MLMEGVPGTSTSLACALDCFISSRLLAVSAFILARKARIMLSFEGRSWSFSRCRSNSFCRSSRSTETFCLPSSAAMRASSSSPMRARKSTSMARISSAMRCSLLVASCSSNRTLCSSSIPASHVALARRSDSTVAFDLAMSSCSCDTVRRSVSLDLEPSSCCFNTRCARALYLRNSSSTRPFSRFSSDNDPSLTYTCNSSSRTLPCSSLFSTSRLSSRTTMSFCALATACSLDACALARLSSVLASFSLKALTLA
mmetsp:Transcript_46600/g.76096  ORF Transcript_46600/g.76096 Transcript_46600/m.76096 type:complete len:256 (-) Transcript_46600:44-811(-)